MNYSLVNMNQDSWGQFIDIEKNIVYIPPNEEVQILYVITSLSLFQILVLLFIIFEYFLAN